MGVSGASPAARALVVLARPFAMRAVVALAVVVSTLGGCAPTGAQSERITPSAHPLYPQVTTYPNIRVIEDVTYSRPSGATLDVCLPKKSDDAGPRAAVLSIHGGSWREGDKANINWRSVCQWLASVGFVTFSVDYALAPQHPFPAGIDDVRAAVRFMRSADTVEKYDIDPKRIGAFGGSAGGNLAALLGVEGSGGLTSGSRVAAVAELSGPTNLTASGEEQSEFRPLELSYLGCANFDECANAVSASPVFQVDDSDPPFFIGHSLNERIPLNQSKDFVRALRRHKIDVTFVTIAGQLHSIAMLDADMRSRIADFLHAKLDLPSNG